jgi:hypothetical protein
MFVELFEISFDCLFKSFKAWKLLPEVFDELLQAFEEQKKRENHNLQLDLRQSFVRFKRQRDVQS